MSVAAPAESRKVSNTKGFFLNFAIVKVDRAQRTVWGRATDETRDIQGEVVEYEASVDAFTQWTNEIFQGSGGKSLGNVREMHGHTTIGKVIAWTPDPVTRSIMVGVKLSDTPDGDAAWKKVDEGILNGFSIGAPPPVTREMKYDDKYQDLVVHVTWYRLAELSLVDNPANPSSFFTMVKAAGGVAEISKAAGEFSAAEIKAGPTGEELAVRISPNAFIDRDGTVWKHSGTWVKEKPEDTMTKPAALAKAPNITPNQNVGNTSTGAPVPQANVNTGTVMGGGNNIANPTNPVPTPTTTPVGPGQTIKDADSDADAGSMGKDAAQVCPKCGYSMGKGAAKDADADAGKDADADASADAAAKDADADAAAKAAKTITTPAILNHASPEALAGLQKSLLGSISDGFKKAAQQISSTQELVKGLVGRIEALEKSPTPGGPARTELPLGVAPASRGAADDTGGLAAAQAHLAKAVDAVRDNPFAMDQLSRAAALLDMNKTFTGAYGGKRT